MIDPYQELGLESGAVTDETVRAAYTQAIRRHPPDRDPAAFERIRAAYETIKTEKDRIRFRLFGAPVHESISDYLPDTDERRRVGSGIWLSVIETETKRLNRKNPYGKSKPESTKGD
ncbi:MAG: DnaJ domain-containing protein [bacterium]